MKKLKSIMLLALPVLLLSVTACEKTSVDEDLENAVEKTSDAAGKVMHKMENAADKVLDSAK